MCHGMRHVGRNFVVYFVNLIGMDTKIKSSIDLGRLLKYGKENENLKGIPKGTYL